MRPFGEAQSKAMRAYAQSIQYHTIVKSRVRLTVRTRPNIGHLPPWQCKFEEQKGCDPLNFYLVLWCPFCYIL